MTKNEYINKPTIGYYAYNNSIKVKDILYNVNDYIVLSVVDKIYVCKIHYRPKKDFIYLFGSKLYIQNFVRCDV